METKNTHIALAAEDFFVSFDNAKMKYKELEKQLKEADAKKLYAEYRKITQQMNANKEFREAITEKFYEKIKRLRTELASTES